MSKPLATYRVEGARELRRTLRTVHDGVEDLKDANAQAAAIVASAAVARAPRRTGRLISSVRGNRAAGRATVTYGGARLPYAGPIHWGHPARNIAAQPFVTDAATDTEPVWLPAYERALQSLLATASRYSV
ncbi:HK97 gp10 family phage protein [Jannaschia sp. R86511]|uniref:HK97 gp10 family phage protein n=1 Tax=Jannaschia sp. R86511 TaxID=3093853 RepID=UPI0036D2659D